MKAREQYKSFDVTEYLGSQADMALYLQAMIEESDGDPTMLGVALGDIARARGMSQLARDTGIAREALYKALSPRGNPELATVTRVLAALGLQFTVRPRIVVAAKKASPKVPVAAKAGPRVRVSAQARKSAAKALAAAKVEKTAGQRTRRTPGDATPRARS